MPWPWMSVTSTLFHWCDQRASVTGTQGMPINAMLKRSCLALPCSLVYSLDTTVSVSLLWPNLKGNHPHSPLLLSRRPLTTTKDILVKQGADSNRNMADYGYLFDDEIPVSGSSLGSGVHMSMVCPWTSTGAEPTCECSLHSLYFEVLVFDGRQVVALLRCGCGNGIAGKFDSDLDFQADSTTDVRLARTKNSPVRPRVFKLLANYLWRFGLR